MLNGNWFKYNSCATPLAMKAFGRSSWEAVPPDDAACDANPPLNLTLLFRCVPPSSSGECSLAEKHPNEVRPMIRFACPKCKKTLSVNVAQAGSLVQCSDCKTQMRAPAAPPAAPTPPSAPARSAAP